MVLPGLTPFSPVLKVGDYFCGHFVVTYLYTHGLNCLRSSEQVATGSVRCEGMVRQQKCRGDDLIVVSDSVWCRFEARRLTTPGRKRKGANWYPPLRGNSWELSSSPSSLCSVFASNGEGDRDLLAYVEDVPVRRMHPPYGNVETALCA